MDNNFVETSWFRLSIAQRSRYFVYELEPHSGGNHNNVFSALLKGPIQLVNIEAALRRLVSRHSMLRAEFALDNSTGEPRQRVHAEMPFSLNVVDATDMSPLLLATRVHTDAWKPFIGGKEVRPLLRANVYLKSAIEAVFLLALDHLICDGWSYWQLLDELSELLAGNEEMAYVKQDVAQANYRDYVNWQCEWVSGPKAAQQLAYWRKALDGVHGQLRLPFDRPRPAQSSGQQGIVTHWLNTPLKQRLQQGSAREGATVYNYLMVTLQTLLHRYSGQESIVVGTPVPCRSQVAWKNIVGDFVNTLSIRADFDSQPTARILLQHCQRALRSGIRNQDIPFPLLVEHLHHNFGSTEHPLYQVSFMFQKARRASSLVQMWNNRTPEQRASQWGKMSLHHYPFQQHVGQDRIALTLHAMEIDDEVRCDFVYDMDVFEQSTVQSMANQFMTLLAAMIDDPDKTVQQLPLLSVGECQRVLETFNDTAVTYPSDDELIHQLFERQVAAQPDAIAVICDDQQFSYGQLNTGANQLAHHLIELGLKPDDRAAICVERGLDLVVGLLGILKAGGAYLPLDPAYPVERLQYMLEDAAPKVLLTQKTPQHQLPSQDMPVLLLDGDELRQKLAVQPVKNTDLCALRSNHLAYVIYTSGSTGMPKGVMIEHRAVVNFLCSMSKRPGITANDTLLAITTLSFDIAGLELYLPLINGARMVLAHRAMAGDGTQLIEAIERYSVSILQATPASWRVLLAGNWQGSPGLRALCGGEALPVDLSTQLLSRVGDLWNLYGPTEATIWSSCEHIDSAGKRGQSVEPIGRPIANTRVYILDVHCGPVPVGVTGEIYIGGDGVARGYLNRDELTAEHFLNDPFSEKANSRMYKTGDLGRWLSDGTIEYLGRNDYQVKIRGFRIELGEIEAKLAACEEVREAVVVAREDEPGNKRLVAYLMENEGRELSASQLRQTLSVQLPEYMVPSAFVKLDVFPLTANGKLNRQALPVPDAEVLNTREYEAPQGKIEQTLAKLWQELLQVEKVGRHDQFFELGGHSLLAVQLVSRIRAELEVELSLRTLFAHTSLSALADAVRVAGASTMGRIEGADRGQPLPLSLAQQRLWFLDQLDNEASAAYHMPAALRLLGQLNVAALQNTLNTLVARHEGLRTHFVNIDGVPYQQFAAEDEGFALLQEDLSDLAPEERERVVVDISAKEAGTAFDLSSGPLIRGQLLKLNDEEQVLLITQHHIISDGWSLNIIVREVAALYTAFSGNEANPLAPLAIQYADYAQWQRNWLQGEELERQLDFWREQLKGSPTLLDLPLDRPRPAMQSHEGDAVPLELSPELTRQLRVFSQRHGVTLFMTLLTGWGVVLWRLSGQDDVLIGTPVANRQRREVEDLIGFFVNTLALRIRFDDQPSVGSLLAQLKETTLSAFAHQQLPFEQVVEAVQPVRSTSHSPLFQSMFALNNTDSFGDGELTLPGLRLAPVDQSLTAVQHDLSMNLSEAGEAVSGFVGYATALFDRATVERWVGYFIKWLEVMLVDEQAPVNTLSLLSVEERQQLLQGFNQTVADYPRDALIHDLFEHQATMQPDAIAVVDEQQSLSYSELNSRANQLAHQLMELGVQADDRVAICVERSLDMVVGLLGILKAGGAYLPLDPGYPAERLQYLLEDAAPKVLLTQKALQQNLSTAELPLLVLDNDEFRQTLAMQVADNPKQHTLRAEHLAYVIYTSGSTGTPKGVMVEHRSVNRLVCNNRYFQAGPGDVLAFCANPAFDAATWEIWGALLNGARLQVISSAVLLNGEQLRGKLQQQQVNILHLTVGLFNQHAEALTEFYPTLDYLLFGGEKADAGKVRQVLKQGRPRHLVQCYGPTETTTFASTHGIESLSESALTVPIGKPIGNTRIYLLDAQGEPVPLGVEGEIYIGGDGVARGYLNRDELTAERFLNDPFSEEPKGRMYKTGDLGRWLPNGTIEYLGRNDLQVKIRGFRIEPGEIEARLATCEGVCEAVVLLREDVPGDKRLVAYLLTDEGITLEVAALREILLTQLPAYMVPSAFVVLESLPLTANGKLDRQALPAPETDALSLREYQAPQGEIEQTLAQLWQELLGVEKVGRHDQFFELGGHSLLAVQLVSRIRVKFDVELPLRSLFANAGLSALADAVREAGASTMGGIERADRRQPLPLSLAQQRLWFLDQLDKSASGAYHIPAALRLLGQLDVPALQATLNRLLARHEGLRTYFIAIDGVPYQQFAAEDKDFALVQEDLSHLPHEAREASVADITAKEAGLPFDLRSGPLIRGQLLKLSDEEHVLLMTQHHIISDGWSINVMVQEVGALYTAFSQGKKDPLPPLSLQYVDYAQWQRSWLQGEELERQLNFWLEQLKGVPTLLDLPLDRPRPAVQSYAGGSVPLVICADLSEKLRAFSQCHGVTLFMTLLAGWGALLSRLSGQDDVLIGTPVANRQRREVEDLIGFFVNTLALRVRFDDRPSVSSLLAQLKETTLSAFAHQELPFEQVVEAIQPQRSLNHNPLSQAEFAFNNTQDGYILALPNLHVMLVNKVQTTAQHHVSLHLSEQGDELHGIINYASDLFDHSTIERWVNHYLRLLDTMIQNEAANIRTLSLLSLTERSQLLYGFNARVADYPQDSLIHELFEGQAAAQSAAVAVIYGGEQLSYEQLNEKANRLCRYLQDFGLSTGSFVGVYLERSLEQMIALLACLKAGVAYVPLALDRPGLYTVDLIQDAGIECVLLKSSQITELPLGGYDTVMMDAAVSDSDWLDDYVDGAITTNAGPDDLAYLLYTSGSTGRPKGVAVSHRAVVNYLNHAAMNYLSDVTGTVVSTPLAFDATLTTLMVPWLQGKSSHLLVEDSDQYLHELLESFQKTTPLLFKLTPAHLEILANMVLGPVSDIAHKLVVGGEQLSRQQLQKFKTKVLPKAIIINEYGPTETVVGCSYFVCTEYDLESTSVAVSIGKPIANTQMYILDEFDEPVPVGVSGEIYIGGDGVARGYLSRDQLSAERFIVDPFSDRPNARMYKTGDLGRWLPDGNIEFLGRNDFQIKIRGFRIELGEIEAKLMVCDGVREAVVLAHEEAGDKRLIAYFIADEGMTLSAQELRQSLLTQLPEYMLPAAFVTLESFPLTVNGKLDRKALPAPQGDALNHHKYEVPQGEIEKTLAELWQALLPVERIGRHDQFFELGGHSLLAVQLVSRIRTVLNVELPLRSLFAHSSLMALAEEVREAGASTMGCIEHADRSQLLPLSLAQQRLWFLDQLDKAASAAYHMPAALRLLGQLDVSALQATLDRLLARHESLRTHFVAIDGVPYQQFAQEGEGFVLQHKDFSHLSAEQWQAKVAMLAASEVRTPFDLSVGPLIRGQLLKLHDQEHMLLITQHHIISDGWSLNIIVREVAALYTAIIRNEADSLAPLDIQYADYAQWQRNWLQGESLQRQIDYWREHLEAAPALLDLPLDRPRSAMQSHTGDAVSLELSPELSRQLRVFSQRQGVTLFMTLFTGWSVLLSRLSSQHDIVIGTPVANRQRREVEDLIGFFVNTLALRIRLDEKPRVAALLAQVKETTLSAFAHQELPFEQVVEAVQPLRSLNHSPLFQSMFVFNNTDSFGAAELALPGLQLVPVDQSLTVAQQDLSVNLSEVGETVTGFVDYATALFDRTTVERWTGYYQQILAAMLVDEAAQVDTLPLLSAEERQWLLQAFNQTTAEYPREELIHELFEQQAAVQPAAVAVVYQDESLSYSELNARANQLAHYLIAQGVKPDDRVAICVERSLDMVVGLLGILKAGGAYLPLDPAYLSDRLRYMLEDGLPKLLLTQESLHGSVSGELPILLLDRNEDLEALSERNPDARSSSGLTSKHLAYVIYTSGSTGQPKGVMVEHSNVLNLVEAHIRNCQLSKDDCVLQFSSVSFDASVEEIFSPLAVGATIVVRSAESIACGKTFNQFLTTHRITVAEMPTAFWAQWMSTIDGAIPPGLQLVVVGGEKAERRHLLSWRSAAGESKCRWLNTYGPTETTVYSVAFALEQGMELPVAEIPIGRPIANTQIYLLDAQSEPVPVGVAGEIYIGGDGVTRGYLYGPELTAEHFLIDPFSDRLNGRMYKTGDLGRWLPDGNIEYLGRNDFQIKIRGFRIEPGEIETRLAACEGVREVVILARQDVPGDKRLVAYLIADEGVSLSASQLRQNLSVQLPEYMLPSAFVTLKYFPLTANGKLDRKALSLSEADDLSSREYEAPQGEVEETLATLWKNLLNIARVGRHDNFFELGGHSLLAVQLRARISDVFLVDVPLRSLMVAESFLQLGEKITALQLEKFMGADLKDMEQELSSLSSEQLKVLIESESV